MNAARAALACENRSKPRWYTVFLHSDFAGKRVLVWRRGVAGSESQVVVVANFSDFGTDTSVAGAEYRVPNWPATPPRSIGEASTRRTLLVL